MRRASLLVALVVVVAVGVGVDAQQRGTMMTKERSWEVQGIVGNVEASKAAAVEQFLNDWQANLDQNIYDVRQELGAAAAAAPAWQLYGAALTGDFHTAVRILRGQEGAGKYINALSAPQVKVAKGFGISAPQVVGDPTNSLVFTPIAPCRMVDTRGSGARTGVIAANATRSFDVTTNGFSKGQGSATSCTGLPGYSHPAWALNVTVTNGYVAAGGLKAWGFSGTEPNASIINFGPATSGGIANGLTLAGCDGCVDDITIRAFGDATHVIIDVVGYYQEATAANSTVSRIAGTPVVIAAGGSAFGSGGACPAGTTLISGENDFTGNDVSVGESRQASATVWTIWHINHDASSRTSTVYSRCLDTPVRALP